MFETNMCTTKWPILIAKIFKKKSDRINFRMTSWALPCWNQASDFQDHTSVRSRCRWSVANRGHSTFPTFRHWRPTTSPSWCSSRSTAWPRRGWPRRRPRPRWSHERSTPDAGRFRSNTVHLNWNKVFKVRTYWNMENVFSHGTNWKKHSIYDNFFSKKFNFFVTRSC